MASDDIAREGVRGKREGGGGDGEVVRACFFLVVLAEESYWFSGWRDQSFLGLFFVLSMSIDISGLTASLPLVWNIGKAKR